MKIAFIFNNIHIPYREKNYNKMKNEKESLGFHNII